MKLPIEFTDLQSQYQECKHDIDHAIQEVLDTNNFITGNAVFGTTTGYRDTLEQMIMDYIGCESVASCGSGTMALIIALKACGIGPGDEVIVPSHTFVSTPESIAVVGASPVFVDIDDYYHIDIDKIENAITDKTKAILFVDIYGQSPDINKIIEIKNKHNLYLIEDAAQAFGSDYLGTKLGAVKGVDLACVSFNPVKNLGAVGDAGCVMGRKDLIEECKMYRDHGRRVRFEYEKIGYNTRIDNIQAAVLCAKLPYLDKWMNKKQEICRKYNDAFKDVQGIIKTLPEVPWSKMTFYVYNIQVERRDELMQWLKDQQIYTNIHFRHPCHVFEPYHNGVRHPLPITEQVSKHIVSLPSSQHLDTDQQDYIIQKVKEFYHNEIRV